MAKQAPSGVNGLSSLYRARQLAEKGTAPTDEAFEKAYPTLFSLMTNNRIDDKTVADPAVLRVSNAAGDWCFALSVPSLAAYSEVMASTFEDGLRRLEANLATGNIGWRFNLKKKPATRKLNESSHRS